MHCNLKKEAQTLLRMWVGVYVKNGVKHHIKYDRT